MIGQKLVAITTKYEHFGTVIDANSADMDNIMADNFDSLSRRGLYVYTHLKGFYNIFPQTRYHNGKNGKILKLILYKIIQFGLENQLTADSFGDSIHCCQSYHY